MHVLSELNCGIRTRKPKISWGFTSIKFVALEQENQRFLGDLQQLRNEKAQQYDAL